MNSLTLSLMPYAGPLLVGLIVLQFIIILWLWHNHGEIRRLEGRIRRLLETGESLDLAAVLERFHDLREVNEAINRLQEKVQDLQVGLDKSFSRIGLVRFNAFPDTGSDLSFALAILNREGHGFILSSLYARDETRVFIKPIHNGRSNYRLSEEEEKALAMAMGLINPDKVAV